MPELPEVEVVRAGLGHHVPGRRIESVQVLDTRSLRRHLAGPEDFIGRLAGARLESAVRRGKFLWLPLDGDSALVVHLGMSGQVLLHRSDQPLHRHTRIVLQLDPPAAANGFDQIRFQDQRLFGGFHIAPLLPTADAAPGGHSELPVPALVPAPVAHIARDPLDPHFDPAAVLARMRRRRTGVKRALLDQGLVSGVGNIYADEALWRAKVHYAAPTDTTRPSRLAGVLLHAAEVMEQALAEGGTSFDDLYVNVNGESGYFSRSLSVYGRAGQPCLCCGTAIRREAFMNRGSHFCPRCQRAPRRRAV